MVSKNKLDWNLIFLIFEVSAFLAFLAVIVLNKYYHFFS